MLSLWYKHEQDALCIDAPLILQPSQNLQLPARYCRLAARLSTHTAQHCSPAAARYASCVSFVSNAGTMTAWLASAALRMASNLHMHAVSSLQTETGFAGWLLMKCRDNWLVCQTVAVYR
jgi:hypothetical protein